ncbi:MAG: hypothetical protein IPO48_19955 [Saprospiraceae bacterium]|nr:hypothetical protein [Saprospiraceae bacterium]
MFSCSSSWSHDVPLLSNFNCAALRFTDWMRTKSILNIRSCLTLHIYRLFRIKNHPFLWLHLYYKNLRAAIPIFDKISCCSAIGSAVISPLSADISFGFTDDFSLADRLHRPLFLRATYLARRQPTIPYDKW